MSNGIRKLLYVEVHFPFSNASHLMAFALRKLVLGKEQKPKPKTRKILKEKFTKRKNN